MTGTSRSAVLRSAEGRRRQLSLASGIALVLLLAFPAAFGSHRTLAPPSTWSATSSHPVTNCAHAWAAKPNSNNLTGTTHFAAAAKGTTCPSTRGGQNVSSVATTRQFVEVLTPLTFATGPGGVNVSWDIRASGSVTLSPPVGTMSCPVARSNSSVHYYFSWVNTTSFRSDCQASTSLTLTLDAYVEDTTTMTNTFYSDAFWMIQNASSSSFSIFDLWRNYSNPYYYPDNDTDVQNTNRTVPQPVAFAGAHYAPTIHINGTFRAKHTYLLVTYLEADLSVLVRGYNGPVVSTANLNLATNGNHARFTGLTVW